MSSQQPPHNSDAQHPTATAPASVENSVYEEAEHAGKDGPNAASRPTAEHKKEKAEDADTDPGADLDPDEAADLLRSQEDASKMEDAQRDDLQDEDLISLDGSD